MTKSQTGIFQFGPKSHTNRELQNGKCPLPVRGHILAFALYTSSVTDWDHSDRHDIHMCHCFIWGDDLYEILCNFSFSNLYSSFCKYAMPFQQKHNFYQIILIREFDEQLWSTLTGFLSQLTFSCFIEIKWMLLPSCVHVSSCEFAPASRFNFPSSFSPIVPCNILSSTQP